MVLLPEGEGDSITDIGGDIRRVVQQLTVGTHNDLVVHRCGVIVACLCAVRTRRSAGCRLVTHLGKLLECGEGIWAVGWCVDAEHHSGLAVTGLPAVSPNWFGVINFDLECGKVTGDSGAHGFATRVG